ncbi:MAG: hypothetical protein ACC645_27820 [Pirellulales bacterium]
MRKASDAFYAGDVVTAMQELEKQSAKRPSEQDVLNLDLAVAQLFSGHPQEAEQTLRTVRDRFDYLEQTNVAESTWSMFTDDNRRAYAGEDYEKLLIRVMLALANLAGDGEDAEAYSLQVNAKQQQIINSGKDPDGTNPKLAYQRVALGAYLRGILREETHGNYDDVERSFAKVVSWQPDFRPASRDLERARRGVHSAPGNGVLHVIACVGRGPYKREVREIPTSGALLIADRILSAVGDHSLPPTVAAIKVPQVVVFQNEIQHVAVNVDGNPIGVTATITDVGQLAVQQYEAVYPYVIARAVSRRALKKAAIYAAKTQLHHDSGWVDLAMNVAGVAWEATESADTRCWSMLPDTVQVLRIELPAGQHLVTLQAARRGFLLGPESAVAIHIEDGRNTYALANFPGTRIAGQILVSGRP